MGPHAWEYWLETTFAVSPISRFWALVTADPGTAGPSSSTMVGRPPGSWRGLAASCNWCDKVLWFTTLAPLLNHTCPPHHLLPNKMPTFGSIWDRLPSEPDSDHGTDEFLDQLQAEHENDQHYWQDGAIVWPVQGRGSLQTCGDVEPNPGPSAEETHTPRTLKTCQHEIRTSGNKPASGSRSYCHKGRGSLLTCGDIEENPGPQKTQGRRMDENTPDNEPPQSRTTQVVIPENPTASPDISPTPPLVQLNQPDAQQPPPPTDPVWALLAPRSDNS